MSSNLIFKMFGASLNRYRWTRIKYGALSEKLFCSDPDSKNGKQLRWKTVYEDFCKYLQRLSDDNNILYRYVIRFSSYELNSRIVQLLESTSARNFTLASRSQDLINAMSARS